MRPRSQVRSPRGIAPPTLGSYGQGVDTVRLKLLSIWVWAATSGTIVGFTFLTGLVWLLTTPLDPRRGLTSRTFRSASRVVSAAHPFWKHTISGTLPPDASHGYVIISNHESHADSVLIAHLPFSARWMAKEELLRIPFLGWMMRMAGDIPVRRGDRASGVEALGHMADHLRAGGSVVIFPEGTRSADGTMGPFKDGAFRLAIETQRPILPLVLTGCGQALPKGGWVLGQMQTQARLHILPPVVTAGLSEADLPELRETIRARMVDARNALMAEQTKAA